MDVGTRVLVADDDEVIRRLISVNLELEGFDVATAVDGADCLAKAHARPPHVIVLDVLMPNLDGLATLDRLRSDPDLAGVRVCVVSALARETEIQRGLGGGADAYLTKPFDPAELVRTVARLATGHDLRHE